MDNEIKVSILCMAYNHEKYIENTLKGFVNQKTNFKYEVLINDDCSTDNTANIIKKYELMYPDIIKPIYQKENQYSKNIPIWKTFLIPKSKGKYFAVCEGDDYWIDENKLQMQYNYMEKHPECFCCTHGYRIFFQDSDNYYNDVIMQQESDITINDILGTYNWHYATCSLFFKKELYLSLPQCFYSKYCGDIQIFIYGAILGPVHYFPEIMSQYNKGVNNSATSKLKNKDYLVGVLEDRIEMLNKVNIYYNYKYNDTIKKYNNLVLIRVYFLTEQYKAIKQIDKYNELKKDLSLKDRIIINIGSFSKGLLNCLRKINKLLKCNE